MEMAVENETIHIRIPMKLRKRAGRKEIVLPPDAGSRLEQSGQQALVRSLARAHMWQAMLESGEAVSISDLATRFHVDHSYVARTLRLATLAPDIVEKILSGNEPDGLTLARLMRPFSAQWDVQRTELCGELAAATAP
jgi:hypothetical protein